MRLIPKHTSGLVLDSVFMDTDTLSIIIFRQGFDAPFKFWGRKNEVFVTKKSTSS